MAFIVPGRDPLGFLEFVNNATRLTFTVELKEVWTSERQRIIREVQDYFEGMFDIVLGDESKLQDDSAEFVLYVEAFEVDKAKEYLKRYG